MGVTAEGKIYSLYSSRDPRMVLRFGVKDTVLGIEEEIPFVIDTGATCVVLPAKDLYLGQQEERLAIHQLSIEDMARNWEERP